jgi:hypothetical protein
VLGNTLTTRGWVADEARALLTRVSRVRPLLAQESMPAAATHPRAQRAIEAALHRDQLHVMARLRQLLGWLTSPAATYATGAELQDRLTRVRMQFNDALSNYDLFADAITQRSEHDTGLWLAGLDVAAEDVLSLPAYYEAPPVLCYLDRGPGAAIRRARTRLPGGGSNPVALIQIPRERMIGAGVAASLAHETGHQAAALLRLVESLRAELRAAGGDDAWRLWDRWISEIAADLWAVAKLGPTATMGLVGVLSLPTYFVFRISTDDPHPPPWLRVKLSVALGGALYPDPQWAELGALWDELYPLDRAPVAEQPPLRALASAIPRLRDRLLGHRSAALSPFRLGEAISIADRTPARLRSAIGRRGWLQDLPGAPPSRALATVGQARWSRAITPEDERRVVSGLLTTWAIRRASGPTDSTSHNATDQEESS